MHQPLPRPAEPACAPEPFRAALAELVQIGMSVARMVGRAAEAEAALAEAASAARVAEGISPLATSLAEAMAADQAAAAAGEARRSVITRTEIVAAAFDQTARAIRRTVLLAERLDRVWARPAATDTRHAMARRQIARAVSGAIANEAEGDRAERLTEAAAERLDSLDTLDDIASRPAEDIIRDICRDLGLDPARNRLHPPLPLAGEGRGEGGVTRMSAGRSVADPPSCREGKARPKPLLHPRTRASPANP